MPETPAPGGALAAAGVLARRHRRRDDEEEQDDDLVPAVPAGVRVFDMTPDAPLEITGSLFEPRSARDERERLAREREVWEDGRTAGRADRVSDDRVSDDRRE